MTGGIQLVWTLERVGVTVEVPNFDVKKLRADLIDALKQLDKQTDVPKSSAVVCKVCGKPLASRRSVGGHMRSHPTQVPVAPPDAFDQRAEETMLGLHDG